MKGIEGYGRSQVPTRCGHLPQLHAGDGRNSVPGSVLSVPLPWRTRLDDRRCFEAGVQGADSILSEDLMETRLQLQDKSAGSHL